MIVLLNFGQCRANRPFLPKNPKTKLMGFYVYIYKLAFKFLAVLAGDLYDFALDFRIMDELSCPS